MPGLYVHNDKDFQRNFTLKWSVEDNCYKDKRTSNLMPFLSKVYGDRDQNQKISLVIMKDKMLCQLISDQSSKNYVQRLHYLSKLFLPGQQNLFAHWVTHNRWKLANQMGHSASLRLLYLDANDYVSEISRVRRGLRSPQPLLLSKIVLRF